MKNTPDSLNNLTYQIIGAAMEVHRTLGPGLLEIVYEEALCIELEDRQISYERQKPAGILYKGRAIGDLRLDILVSDLVVVELKSVESLLPIHTAQTLTYLKITNRPLGLLINFNVTVLKTGIKRLAF